MAIQINDLPEITINGEKLEDYVFTDMILNKELLKPNEFRFTLRKKDLNKTASDIAFELCDKLLGAKVECKVKTLHRNEEQDEVGEELAFTGIIFNANTQREIMGKGVVVNCVAYSPDYLLIDAPHCESFLDKNLKEIIDTAIAPVKNDIEVEVIPKMTEVIHYTVQYQENTYQFLSRLAQRWGEFFYFEDGKLVFGKLKQTDPVELYPDVDILGYYYDVNLGQNNVDTAFWGYSEPCNYVCPGDTMASLDTKESHPLTEAAMKHSSELYKKQIVQMVQSASQEQSLIDNSAQAGKTTYYYKKARMMMCKAVSNRSDLKLGSVVVIKEYADTDSGVELKSHEPLQIIGINYKWDINGHFESEFTGIPSNLEYPPYMNSDLYPVSGVQHAWVVDNNDEELNLGRVRVTFQWQGFHDDSLSPWIRVARPYAGDGKGFIYTPEQGEEVLVGFENNNVEKPFVIGSVHNGDQKPKTDWDNNGNTVKGFRTLNHEVLVCDAEDGIGYIRISDHENHFFDILLDADSKAITVKSAGDIIFEAGNDISFKAKHHIYLRSGHRLVEQVGTSYEQHIGRDALIDVGNTYCQQVTGEMEVSCRSDVNHFIDGKYEISGADDIAIFAGNTGGIYASKTLALMGESETLLGNSKSVVVKGQKIDIDGQMINLGQ